MKTPCGTPCGAVLPSGRAARRVECRAAPCCRAERRAAPCCCVAVLPCGRRRVAPCGATCRADGVVRRYVPCGQRRAALGSLGGG
eukprot:gene9187-biopygen3696